jgi:hypothetical protein
MWMVLLDCSRNYRKARAAVDGSPVPRHPYKHILLWICEIVWVAFCSGGFYSLIERVRGLGHIIR